MRDTRTAVIAHHVRAALRHSGLNERSYAMTVVEVYQQRTPAHARTVHFSEAGDYYARERSHTQHLHRLLLAAEAGEAQAHRLPADLEEACVLALPQPFQQACMRELADRYGLLAAPQADASAKGELMRSADLLRETGEALLALAADWEGGSPEALERADAELRDVEAVVASLRATLRERRAHQNTVPIRRTA